MALGYSGLRLKPKDPIDVSPWRHDLPTGGPCAVCFGLAGPREGQRVFFIQASMLTIIATSTASCTGCFILGATISPGFSKNQDDLPLLAAIPNRPQTTP